MTSHLRHRCKKLTSSWPSRKTWKCVLLQNFQGSWSSLDSSSLRINKSILRLALPFSDAKSGLTGPTIANYFIHRVRYPSENRGMTIQYSKDPSAAQSVSWHYSIQLCFNPDTLSSVINCYRKRHLWRNFFSESQVLSSRIKRGIRTVLVGKFW